MQEHQLIYFFAILGTFQTANSLLTIDSYSCGSVPKPMLDETMKKVMSDEGIQSYGRDCAEIICSLEFNEDKTKNVTKFVVNHCNLAGVCDVKAKGDKTQKFPFCCETYSCGKNKRNTDDENDDEGYDNLEPSDGATYNPLSVLEDDVPNVPDNPLSVLEDDVPDVPDNNDDDDDDDDN